MMMKEEGRRYKETEDRDEKEDKTEGEENNDNDDDKKDDTVVIRMMMKETTIMMTIDTICSLYGSAICKKSLNLTAIWKMKMLKTNNMNMKYNKNVQIWFDSFSKLLTLQ